MIGSSFCLHRYLQLGSPKPLDVPDDADGFELPAIELVSSKPLDGRLIEQDDEGPVPDAFVDGARASADVIA